MSNDTYADWRPPLVITHEAVLGCLSGITNILKFPDFAPPDDCDDRLRDIPAFPSLDDLRRNIVGLRHSFIHAENRMSQACTVMARANSQPVGFAGMFATSYHMMMVDMSRLVLEEIHYKVLLVSDDYFGDHPADWNEFDAAVDTIGEQHIKGLLDATSKGEDWGPVTLDDWNWLLVATNQEYLRVVDSGGQLRPESGSTDIQSADTPKLFPKGLPSDLIDTAGVAKLVLLETTSMRPYRKDWPDADVPKSGRASAKWSYTKLLPTLKKQFPAIEFPAEHRPAAN